VKSDKFVVKKDIHLHMKQIRVSSLEKFLLTDVRTVGLPADR